VYKSIFHSIKQIWSWFIINRKPGRIKKTFAILLALCFVLSVTAASASAAGNSRDGYSDGYKKGYDDGKKQGQKDCEQYGGKETLSKIPSPSNEDGWTSDYKDSYNNGYKKGYIDGYNGIRYLCLK
jgi:flagellar biosynthesis/type III secretory pathway protein FliH